jgi:hypothetical protein
VIEAEYEMADMQSEILFIAKFGGIVFTAAAHYFTVIKPIAIFNERQKVSYKLIMEMKSEGEKIKEAFIKLQTEHDINNCKGNKK